MLFLRGPVDLEILIECDDGAHIFHICHSIWGLFVMIPSRNLFGPDRIMSKELNTEVKCGREIRFPKKLVLCHSQAFFLYCPRSNSDIMVHISTSNSRGALEWINKER